MTVNKALAGLTLTVAFTCFAHAQSTDAAATITDCSKEPTRTAMTNCSQKYSQIKTIFLSNTAGQNDANEILVALRNVFEPSTKMFLAESDHAIVVATYPEEIARIESLVRELDRPHKTYRLTYTLTAMDGEKRVNTQHFSIVVPPGQLSTLKQGSKIPVATGSFSDNSSSSPKTNAVQTQFTYLDVGTNISAQLYQVGDGASLNFKVEQSSLGEKQSGFGAQDPTILQNVINGTTFLTLNKPIVLGSIDITGTTRHTEVEVVMEQVQ